jgi:hypothetical protein
LHYLLLLRCIHKEKLGLKTELKYDAYLKKGKDNNIEDKSKNSLLILYLKPLTILMAKYF